MQIRSGENSAPKGALPVGFGVYWDTLPAGADGLVLTTDSNVPSGVKWAVAGSGGGGSGTVTNITTSGGLTGGPITTTGDISIGNQGVTFAKIQNLGARSVFANSTASAASGGNVSVTGGLGFDGGGNLSLATVPALNVIANTTVGTAVPGAVTLTSLVDAAIGSTQGDILYRSASVWAALAPGTAGQPLLTGGASANPSFSSTGVKIDSHFGVITVDTVSSLAVTINLATSDKHNVTLDHTGTTVLSLSNATIGQLFRIKLIQDGTGSCLVTWFATIKWAGGTVPTLTTAAGRYDRFVFECTGTNTYDGDVVGQNYN